MNDFIEYTKAKIDIENNIRVRKNKNDLAKEIMIALIRCEFDHRKVVPMSFQIMNEFVDFCKADAE